VKSKTYTQNEQPSDKLKAQNFASWVLGEHAFKIGGKKEMIVLIVVPLEGNFPSLHTPFSPFSALSGGFSLTFAGLILGYVCNLSCLSLLSK